MFICCEASKQNKPDVAIWPEHVAAILRISAGQVTALLPTLESHGLIACAVKPAKSRQDDGGVPSLLHATNVRTYERTNERTDVGEPPPPKIISEPEPEPPDRIISGDPLVVEFLSEGVTEAGQHAWVKLYGDRIWLEAELKKAAANWISNGNRASDGSPKVVFINRWLTRAKDRQQSPPPTAAASPPLKFVPEKKPTKLVTHLDEVTGELVVSVAPEASCRWDRFQSGGSCGTYRLQDHNHRRKRRTVLAAAELQLGLLPPQEAHELCRKILADARRNLASCRWYQFWKKAVLREAVRQMECKLKRYPPPLHVVKGDA